MLGLATKENAEQAEKDLEKAENDNYKKRTMEVYSYYHYSR